MAQRPIYITNTENNKFVTTKIIEFKWFPGMAKSQKQKSISSLHENAKIRRILEISSKSQTELGIELSAFNLIIQLPNGKKCSIEQAFQGSKVFVKGGPFVDLYESTSIKAKRDIRLKKSGDITRFEYFNNIFPLEPKTFFYDWLYIKALNENKQYHKKLLTYTAFSDIEFNPKKSINCQAFSAALFVSLYKENKITEALKSKEKFKQLAYEFDNRNKPEQLNLFT